MFDLKKAHGSVSIGSLGRLALQQHVYFWQRKPNFLAHVFKNGEEGKTMCCEDESAAQMLLESDRKKYHWQHCQSIFIKRSAISTKYDYILGNINKNIKKSRNNNFHIKTRSKVVFFASDSLLSLHKWRRVEEIEMLSVAKSRNAQYVWIGLILTKWWNF